MIIHLFFVYNSLLFDRENLQEAERIMAILQVYQVASGQVVNLEVGCFVQLKYG